MKEILKSISKLSIPTVLNLLLSLVRNKLLALIVGPIGLGIFSQIGNLSAIAYSILPIGSIGLVRYISNYYEDKRINEISYFIKYFFMRNIFISIIISVIIIVFRDFISNLLFSNSDFSNLLILFSLFIPLNLITSFIDIYLRGIRKINVYVVFMSINSIVSLLCTIPLIYFWGIEGAVIALVVSIIISIINGFAILKKNNLLLDFKTKHVVDKSALSNIYKLGIVTLISMAVQNFTILTIKSIIARKLGLKDVGIFQCVYSISVSYFGIFFALMGTYSIPKVSSFKTLEQINVELNETIKFLLLFYIPIIIFIFITRTFVISVLYSSEFSFAKYLLVFQLPAELFRAFSWVMGLWLIPRLKVKQWIIFELIFYSLFLGSFYILIQYFDSGVKSASISYLFSYFIFLLINYFYTTKNINFKVSDSNLKILLISIPFLLTAYLVSYYFEYIGFFILIPILTGWGLLVIKKNDFIKLKDIIRSNKVKNQIISNDNIKPNE